MDKVNSDRTLGDLVAENADRALLMESLGLDFCCGGGRTLAQACQAAGLDAPTVARLLANPPRRQDAGAAGAAEPDLRGMTLTALVNHIEQTHHVYLREQLPRLRRIAAKVREVHGAGHGELVEIEQVFNALAGELELHLGKEEQILFPAVRTLELTHGSVGFHCGSLANPIHVMEMEHDAAGEALARLRELSDGYAVPADACETYRAYYEGLAALERDLHRHIHKENNVLFPRAVALEARGGSSEVDV